jgi:alkylhydroperoxidase family enzyme
MMEFARKVADDSSRTTQEDIDVLKSHGFDDAEIFDITAAAAARCFFAKIADALGAAPDSAFMAMEASLREALTVGRAIEKEP